MFDTRNKSGIYSNAFTIILYLANFFIFELVCSVTSQSVIHVSRTKGNDSAFCGSSEFPCYTISWAVSQATSRSSIILDSINTAILPYDCQPLTSYDSGIYVTKALSFVGRPSFAHVSCKKGRNWIVNGSDVLHAIDVNFTGIAFQNSRLHFVETSITMKHCYFSNTENLVINVTNFQRRLTLLSFTNVLFEGNEACISLISGCGTTELKKYIRIYIKDSKFNNNGRKANPFLLSPSWTILGVDTAGVNDVDIEIRNSSFQGNFVRSSGMIFVKNQRGYSEFLVQESIFRGNGLNDTAAGNSLFVLSSSFVSFVISRSHVKKCLRRFLSMHSMRTNINVLHTTVDDFANPQKNGGVFYVESNEVKWMAKDCFFSNGKSDFVLESNGGLLFSSAHNTSVYIENSVLTNLTTSGNGGVIYATAKENVAALIQINIKNSSFTLNKLKGHSSCGGVVCISTQKKAKVDFNSLSLYSIKMSIENSLFEQNAAGIGGCISVESYVSQKYIEYELTSNNVTFIQNGALKQGGVINLEADVSHLNLTYALFKENYCTFGGGGVINVVRRDLHNYASSFLSLTARHVDFVANHALGLGSALYVERSYRSVLVFRHVTFLNHGQDIAICIMNQNVSSSEILFKRCRFENNTGRLVGGTMWITGKNEVISVEESIFRSNVALNAGGAFAIGSSNSRINLVNTTFFNNTSIFDLGGAVHLDIFKSTVHVNHATFERNLASRSFGAGLAITMSGDTLYNSGCNGHTWRSWKYENFVEVNNTRFIQNVAARGAAVSIKDGSVHLNNCTFIDNLASDEGAHITNYGKNRLRLAYCTFYDSMTGRTLIQTFSRGPLVLINTTVDQQRLSPSGSLIVVSSGGVVEFDNLTSSTCPSGMYSSFLNFSYIDYVNISCRLRVTVLRLQCNKCERGTYSLQRGHTKGLSIIKGFVCLPCPFGAECKPTITSKRNYWGYLIDTSPPTLNFTRCPDGYCLSGSQTSDGFITTCNGKRSGWMCGRCASGYSDSLFSADCKRTEECNDSWFWLVFVVLIFLMASFLVFKPPIVTFAAKQAFWLKNCCATKNPDNLTDEPDALLSSHDEETESIFQLSTEEIENEKIQSVGFLEIIFYFYQISNLLIVSTSLEQLAKTKVLIPVQGFFNFQGKYLGNGYSICPIPGLSPETKQVFDVAPVFGTLVAIYVIYVLHFTVCKILRAAATPTLGQYLSATIETMLLGYIKIANLSFSSIRCVLVGTENRWFYNGTIVCYQWWQLVLVTFDVVIAVPFIFVLAWSAVKLHRGQLPAKQFLLACILPLPFLIYWLLQSLGFRSNQRHYLGTTEYTDALKDVLLAPFREPEGKKSGALYWQSILISRRFLLVFLYSFITDPTLRLLCMGGVCVLTLVHHTKMQPFRNSHANVAETISLLCLVILANINMYRSFYANSKEEIMENWVTISQALDWIEIILLGFLPAACALVVLLGLISLITRGFFALCTCVYRPILSSFRRLQNEMSPLVED